tara:strand:+ start:10 stop:495 length:486 start_codon:yes stop_codon:yes gene_type:complete
MPSDIPLNKRTYYNRKTVPQTGRVRKQKDAIIRIESEDMRRLKYRSKFELELAKKLGNNKVKFEYETKKFLYIPKPRTYTPDFYLPDTGIYIEAKGHLDKADRVKMALVKEQHKDLDIRFVFMNARNKIYKGSKTTYADWCNKHDFRWAEGAIPTEWYKNG